MSPAKGGSKVRVEEPPLNPRGAIRRLDQRTCCPSSWVGVFPSPRYLWSSLRDSCAIAFCCYATRPTPDGWFAHMPRAAAQGLKVGMGPSPSSSYVGGTSPPTQQSSSLRLKCRDSDDDLLQCQLRYARELDVLLTMLVTRSQTLPLAHVTWSTAILRAYTCHCNNPIIICPCTPCHSLRASVAGAAFTPRVHVRDHEHNLLACPCALAAVITRYEFVTRARNQSDSGFHHASMIHMDEVCKLRAAVTSSPIATLLIMQTTHAYKVANMHTSKSDVNKNGHLTKNYASKKVTFLRHPKFHVFGACVFDIRGTIFTFYMHAKKVTKMHTHVFYVSLKISTS